MSDVIVTGDEPDEHDRELGKAEGAAEVHADDAAEQAQRAEEAAELAAGTVDINMNVVAESADNAARAEEAAVSAGLANDSVVNAMSAMTAGLQSLAEEMRASRETQSAPTPKPKEAAPKADKPPAPKPRFRDRYMGGR